AHARETRRRVVVAGSLADVAATGLREAELRDIAIARAVAVVVVAVAHLALTRMNEGIHVVAIDAPRGRRHGAPPNRADERSARRVPIVIDSESLVALPVAVVVLAVAHLGRARVNHGIHVVAIDARRQGRITRTVEQPLGAAGRVPIAVGVEGLVALPVAVV